MTGEGTNQLSKLSLRSRKLSALSSLISSLKDSNKKFNRKFWRIPQKLRLKEEPKSLHFSASLKLKRQRRPLQDNRSSSSQRRRRAATKQKLWDRNKESKAKNY